MNHMRTLAVSSLGTACLLAGQLLAGNSAADVPVRLKGRLGDRLDAMIARHVAGTDIGYITACFREKTETDNGWQTEFWGKYMHSAVPYAAYSRNAKIVADVERGVSVVLASQEADGYIGNYPPERRAGKGWDVWGVKYTMMGLLHYADGCQRYGIPEWKQGDAALAACRRLCDWLIAELGPGGRRGCEVWQTGNWSGLASSSVLEPVVWLYRATGEGKYLDFATYIVKGLSEPEDGPRLVDLALKGVSVSDRNGYGNKPDKQGQYVMKHNRSKAYEMMSCYQGLLDYVEEKVMVDGQGQEWIDNLRRAAVLTAEDIVREEVNLAGGCASLEQWYHGARKQHLPYAYQQETCVLTTWMRLCEKLLDMTGEARWADQIERTFLNAYLAALKNDGSVFAGYTPLAGERLRGQDHCYMHMDCCTANGPRGFLCFLRELFRVKADGAYLNFYTSALLDARHPKTGAKVAFDMYSLYPRDPTARLVSHTDASAGVVPLKLRLPGWCEKMKVTLNGQPVEGESANGYLTIARTWKLGDVVEVNFDMPFVAHKLDHHVAFTRGPVLLARDSRFGDGDLSLPLYHLYADGTKMERFDEVRTPCEDIWMAFSANLPMGVHTENPEGLKRSTVFFCDFASAGNEWRRGNYYRTWLPEERWLGAE